LRHTARGAAAQTQALQARCETTSGARAMPTLWTRLQGLASVGRDRAWRGRRAGQICHPPCGRVDRIRRPSAAPSRGHASMPPACRHMERAAGASPPQACMERSLGRGPLDASAELGKLAELLHLVIEPMASLWCTGLARCRADRVRGGAVGVEARARLTARELRRAAVRFARGL